MEEENNIDLKSEPRGQGCREMLEPFCLLIPIPPQAEKHRGEQQMHSVMEGPPLAELTGASLRAGRTG